VMDNQYNFVKIPYPTYDKTYNINDLTINYNLPYNVISNIQKRVRVGNNSLSKVHEQFKTFQIYQETTLAEFLDIIRYLCSTENEYSDFINNSIDHDLSIKKEIYGEELFSIDWTDLNIEVKERVSPLFDIGSPFSLENEILSIFNAYEIIQTHIKEYNNLIDLDYNALSDIESIRLKMSIVTLYGEKKILINFKDKLEYIIHVLVQNLEKQY